MGTRHLICIKYHNQFKVAQYGQWDGYLDGQGTDILSFLKHADLNRFKFRLDRYVEWITDEEAQSRWVECGADPSNDFVDMEIAKKHKERYPENSRDTGAGILDIIYNANDERQIKLINAINFADDGLFCEYNYVLDFDNNKFTVYVDGKTKLKQFALDALPLEDDFIRDPRHQDEE